MGVAQQDTVETDTGAIFAAAGTIKNLYVLLNGAPGAGTSYDITFYKNGAPQTVTVNIAELATTGSDVANSFSVAEGDRVTIEVKPNGTPTARIPKWGFEFDPTIDGEYPTSTGEAAGTPSQIDVNYMFPIGNNSPIATETSAQVLAEAGVLKKMYVVLKTAPGAGNSLQFQNSVNAAVGTLSVTISGTDTTGNDTVNEDTVVAGDLCSIAITPTSSPAVGTENLVGYVIYVAPSGVNMDTWNAMSAHQRRTYDRVDGVVAY